MRKGMKGIQMFGGSSVVQTEEIRSDVSARQNRAKRVTESTLPLPEENFLTNGIYPNSLLITQHTAYRSNVMRLRRGLAAPWRLYPPRTDARSRSRAGVRRGPRPRRVNCKLHGLVRVFDGLVPKWSVFSTAFADTHFSSLASARSSRCKLLPFSRRSLRSFLENTSPSLRLRRGMTAPWRLYPPRTDARASAVARAPGVSSASFQCQLKFLAQTNGKVNRKSRAFSPRTNGKHSRQF